jgi:hypothetical protein
MVASEWKKDNDGRQVERKHRHLNRPFLDRQGLELCNSAKACKRDFKHINIGISSRFNLGWPGLPAQVTHLTPLPQAPSLNVQIE